MRNPTRTINFLGKPKDWIEQFGRNFFPTVHTHLEGPNAREIMPWLKLSAEMDPKRIDTYVTASYWLRTRLDKPNEAEQFLREGLRANPDSHEILLELGRVYFYNKNNPRVARNIWELALNKWRRQDLAGENPDPHVQEEILGELVRDDQRFRKPQPIAGRFGEIGKSLAEQGGNPKIHSGRQGQTRALTWPSRGRAGWPQELGQTCQNSTAKTQKGRSSLLIAKLALPTLKAVMWVAPIDSAYFIGLVCQGK